MRTCRKCKNAKPDGEFYQRSDSPDGLDRWCKECRKEDSNFRNTHKNRKLPYSTEQALKLLSDNGIPVTVGYLVGRPRKDLVAYGYLTVEAKSALGAHNATTGYVFGMTKTQHVERCDFYILICKDIERVFVVPLESHVLNFDTRALYINVHDPQLAQFENAYHLIKERALRDIQESRRIKDITVFSGQRYYKIAA